MASAAWFRSSTSVTSRLDPDRMCLPSSALVPMVIPRAKKLLHIKTLAEIARLLSRAEVREGLLECNSPADVLAALVELEDS